MRNGVEPHVKALCHKLSSVHWKLRILRMLSVMQSALEGILTPSDASQVVLQRHCMVFLLLLQRKHTRDYPRSFSTFWMPSAVYTNEAIGLRVGKGTVRAIIEKNTNEGIGFQDIFVSLQSTIMALVTDVIFRRTKR